MAKKAVNIYVEEQMLDRIKPLLPNRKLSAFVNWSLAESIDMLEADPGFWLPNKACRKRRKRDNPQS